MKIIVDGMGGDNAPCEIVKGCVEAVNSDATISVVITGIQDKIQQELDKYSFDKSKIEIINATQVITNNESPTLAIRQKSDSSLVVAMKKLKEDDDVKALISAGSTGAVLSGGIFKLGRIKGIARPACCPILPTATDKKVILIDSGANADCKPEFLCQFAIMGSNLSKISFNTSEPKVGLLSNGTEEHKGDELHKNAFEQLKNLKGINFIGNIEGRDIMSGEVDVVVADGFSGNIALKSIEGCAGAIMDILKTEIMSSFKSKIGFLLCKPAFKVLKRKLDYNCNGGAVVIGVEKVVIKSHGSSKAQTIASCIYQARDAVNNNLIENIKESLKTEAGEELSE